MMVIGKEEEMFGQENGVHVECIVVVVLEVVPILVECN